MNKEGIFRVLSIGGGGMRGYYSAVYLHKLKELAEQRFGHKEFELSKQLQMVVGTSSGAIIGAGLVSGLPPERIMNFYATYDSSAESQAANSQLISSE